MNARITQHLNIRENTFEENDCFYYTQIAYFYLQENPQWNINHNNSNNHENNIK